MFNEDFEAIEIERFKKERIEELRNFENVEKNCINEECIRFYGLLLLPFICVIL